MHFSGVGGGLLSGIGEPNCGRDRSSWAHDKGRVESGVSGEPNRIDLSSNRVTDRVEHARAARNRHVRTECAHEVEVGGAAMAMTP